MGFDITHTRSYRSICHACRKKSECLCACSPVDPIMFALFAFSSIFVNGRLPSRLRPTSDYLWLWLLRSRTMWFANCVYVSEWPLYSAGTMASLQRLVQPAVSVQRTTYNRSSTTYNWALQPTPKKIIIVKVIIFVRPFLLCNNKGVSGALFQCGGWLVRTLCSESAVE